MNIGNPGEFTIKELAEQVIQLTGSKSGIVYKPLPSDDPKQRCPDITLARSGSDGSRRSKLTEGLKKTIEYFRTTIK